MLGGEALAALAEWAAEVERWPVGSHIWGHYAERTATGEAVCRTENVAACHAGVADLVDGVLAEVASASMHEPVTAFKDKLNYKHPGGAGFSPHQDARAYPGARRVISLLVAIDACTTGSGCLWIADGVDRLLPTDGRGVVTSEASAQLRWEAAELAPGDAVCIDGLAPHYSKANRTDRPRRVLVASYAPTAEGYGRDRYYAARETTMADASARDGRDRISTLADFDGTTVRLTTVSRACSHG